MLLGSNHHFTEGGVTFYPSTDNCFNEIVDIELLSVSTLVDTIALRIAQD